MVNIGKKMRNLGRDEGARVDIYCSTPNGRGIYNYALMLCRVIGSKHATLQSPNAEHRQQRGALGRLVTQVWWELLEARDRTGESIEIYSYPRLPIATCGAKRRKSVVIVIHDLMETVYISRRKNRQDVKGRMRIVLALKKLYNTIMMLLACSKAKVVIFNSYKTKSEVLGSRLRHALSDASVTVLHPGLSFSKKEIVDSCDIAYKKYIEEDLRVFRVHMVSGQSTNKNFDLAHKALRQVSGCLERAAYAKIPSRV